jgi:hypothetical protein
VFRGLPNPFTAIRYHSLVIERETLPDCLAITAWTDDGEIMGVRHKTLAVEGVQFHPESILTEHGHAMLKNFLKVTRHDMTPMMTPGSLGAVIDHREIFHDEMLGLMRQIMTGDEPGDDRRLITGLRVKKETIGEITAAAMVMREFATKVPVTDTSPGGHLRHRRRYRAHLQHLHRRRLRGRRRRRARRQARRPQSVSSKSGSADVLEALDVNINLTPARSPVPSTTSAWASCSPPTSTAP